MASTAGFPIVSKNEDPLPPQQSPTRGHNRSKSNVLKNFIHRRNNSAGSSLQPSPFIAAAAATTTTTTTTPDEIRIPDYSRPPPALAEIHMNRASGLYSPPSPSKEFSAPTSRRSPTKTLSTISLKGLSGRDADKAARNSDKQKENESPQKPKKTKSTTNLTGLLSRPKSAKNLNKLASEEDARAKKDKENRTPSGGDRPPIYAQFSSGALERQNASDDVFGMPSRPGVSTHIVSGGQSDKPPKTKVRPKSYHAQSSMGIGKPSMDSTSSAENRPTSVKMQSPSKTQRQRSALSILTGGFGISKPKPPTSDPTDVTELVLDPKDIDKHLEAMLDRRNIPEHQRYKMRNLANTIKMEFIRQDWAETRGSAMRPGSNDSDSSLNENKRDKVDKSVKRSRHRSFTLSRNNGKKSEPSSPIKKSKGENTLGRHFRSKSTESVVDERPTSSGSTTGSGILSKIKLQQGPVDFVNYLRKVQRPEAVEVGKLHKLRLLLRNETVAWTDEFTRQGGMQEIVGLLQRIMEVEWREEHEDALLHENLLCLKALCTTALALQYLHSIQATLFPALLHMIFDPEKKGPSEFTTRGIVTSILFTYIQSAPVQDRTIRARTVLNHLRDPEPKEQERPVPFVLEMRRERPYRIWCKEATGVTKEVFWIFLHHINVVYLPREKERKETPPADSQAYMDAHFPQERPPVPAAAYVGGVEWDATNYLASHLDLLNAILACTPTREERNALRGLCRISGWERCMGGYLRLCKEKFYPGVHDALRTWVAAAADDGWDVRDVRYGPPPESKSPKKLAGIGFGGGAAANAANKAGCKRVEKELAPKIEMLKLDLRLDGATGGGGGLKPVVAKSTIEGDMWLD